MISKSDLMKIRAKLPRGYRQIIAERLSISPHTVGSVITAQRTPRADVINEALKCIMEQDNDIKKTKVAFKSVFG
jgi:hypothetical protein